MKSKTGASVPPCSPNDRASSMSEVIAWTMSLLSLPGLSSAIASLIWLTDCAAKSFRHRSPILASKAPPPHREFPLGGVQLAHRRLSAFEAFGDDRFRGRFPRAGSPRRGYWDLSASSARTAYIRSSHRPEECGDAARTHHSGRHDQDDSISRDEMSGSVQPAAKELPDQPIRQTHPRRLRLGDARRSS